MSSGQEKATLSVHGPSAGHVSDHHSGGLVFSESGQVLIRTGEARQPDWIPIDAQACGPPRVLSTGLKNVDRVERMATAPC